MKFAAVFSSAVLAGVIGAASLAAQSDDAVVRGELAKQLDARLTAQKDLSGVFLLARGGEVIYAKGFGLADREHRTPWTPRTISDVGSLVKGVTAAAIVKLQEDGRVAFTDKLSKFFPDVPDDKRDITLHQLLTHTAGFSAASGSDEDPIGRDSLLAIAFKSPLLFKPGTSQRYSNIGFSILAAVVDKVSGMPYERYVQEKLFAPAGMTETGYMKSWPRERLAHGYRRDGAHWGTPIDQPWRSDGPGWHLRGNGGMLSTVNDLYKWLVALQGDRVLTPAGRRALFTPHASEQPGTDMYYGYGWAIVKAPTGIQIWHNGGNGFFFAEYLMLPEQNAIAITMTNSEGPAFGTAWNTVRQTAITGRVPAPVVAVAVPSALLQEYAGVYSGQGGATLTVRAHGDSLFVHSRRGEPDLLIAQSPTRFVVPPKSISAEFTRDSSGKVASLRIEQNGAKMLLTRSGDAAPVTSNDTDWQKSKAGGRTLALLEVLGGADEAAIVRFINENFAPTFRDDFPMEQHVAQFRRMQQRVGPADIVSSSGSGGRIVVKIRSRKTGETMQLDLSFAGPEALIAELRFE